MKNLIAILSLMLVFSISTLANNTSSIAEGDKLVIDNTEVSFTIKNNSTDIISTSFNENKDFFTIETESTINFLQVVNAEGEVDYQLPIGSNILKLALTDFEQGIFQINLLVEGENRFVSTELVRKK